MVKQFNESIITFINNIKSIKTINKKIYTCNELKFYKILKIS
jgi:hypothetical protein